MSIEVVKPGLLTTLQDAGRPGYAHLGIGRSGAFDAPALRLANALCGNPPHACGLEITLAGPTLRFTRDSMLAITGAPIGIRIDGADAPGWSPLHVRAGATVMLGAMRRGCRSYLAVGGGIAIEPVLGSCSTDVNAALGPFARPLQVGDVLPTSATDDAPAPSRAAGHWRLDPRPWFHDEAPRLRLMPGQHLERLTNTSRKALFEHAFTVAKDSNRVGLRLSGPGLDRTAPIEMVSEGCVPGVLQLPPSGEPIALGPECPASGGYPRIGQIAAVDLPRLAQCRPGDAVRFMPCSLDDALHALRKREQVLARLEGAIQARLEKNGYRILPR